MSKREESEVYLNQLSFRTNGVSQNAHYDPNSIHNFLFEFDVVVNAQVPFMDQDECDRAVFDGDVGVLNCILFDVQGAAEEDSDPWADADAIDGEYAEFAEFLLDQQGLVRYELLRAMGLDVNEDDFECINVLCVNGGSWPGNSTAFACIVAQLSTTHKFDLVVVDAAAIRRAPIVDDWREVAAPVSPLRLPHPPFHKVVWDLMAPGCGADPDRYFLVAGVTQLRKAVENVSPEVEAGFKVLEPEL